MNTLYDLGMEISNIRTALNNIEVRGQNNASLLVYAYDKCTELIKDINEIGKAIEGEQKEVGKSESDDMEGEVNAE